MKLNNDNQTCVNLLKPMLLLVGIGNNILSVRHRTFGRHESDGFAKVFHMHIDQMSLNSLTGDVFVADNYAHVIYTVNTSSMANLELVYRNVGNVSAMGFGE